MTNVFTDPTSGMGAQVFGTQNRWTAGQVTSRSEGLVKKLTVYYWPPGVTDDQQFAVLAFMMAYGQSEEERPTAWASWAFTYSVLCFPEMRDNIVRSSREYEFVRLPAEFIDKVCHLCTLAEEMSTSTPDDEYVAAAKDIPYLPKFPEMSHNSTTFAPNFAACQIIPAVYGFFGLLLYLSGKEINAKNIVAITEKRPQNLIDAYKINEEASYALLGDGKMSTAAHAGVNQAWKTYAGARRAIITEIAGFGAGVTLAQRVVNTISRLLEHSGMQPAYFIHRFLYAFPQALTYSCVRPALEAYVSSVREVASAPSHLQPYYKLINGEGTRAFHRSTILLLSACAITYEKHTSPSMKNFDLGEGAAAALAMFDAEAIRRGHTTLQSLTFAAEEGTSAD